MRTTKQTSYQDVMHETAQDTIAWALGKRNDYPFEEIECLMRVAHAPEHDEEARWIVLQDLAIRCLHALNKGQMRRLDYWLRAHSRHELTCI